jgi:hypothetical protein
MLVSILLLFIFRDAEFRQQKDNITAGLVIGAAIVGVWLATSSIMVEADGEAVDLSSYVQNWEFLSDSDENRPAASSRSNRSPSRSSTRWDNSSAIRNPASLVLS